MEIKCSMNALNQITACICRAGPPSFKYGFTGLRAVFETVNTTARTSCCLSTPVPLVGRILRWCFRQCGFFDKCFPQNTTRKTFNLSNHESGTFLGSACFWNQVNSVWSEILWTQTWYANDDLSPVLRCFWGLSICYPSYCS